METSVLAWIGLAAMILSLFLIPLGLPGVWVMIAILFLGVIGGMVSPWIFFVLILLGGLAEFLEFVAMGRMTARYGGTSRTFWGAVIGGLAGALIGTPVPVVGSLIGALLGTVAGAFVLTWHQTRHTAGAARASVGALFGRAVAIGLKVFVGLVIIAVGGASLLLG
ncbi:MAG: DUF456 domain-containing protein [Gemmatimonadetes bacterium]|nr:DUF456 domain-containing protein [Gemmatimonadota bacterium]